MNSPTATMTAAEVRALPLTVDVVTAGRALGLSRDSSYRHARLGQFPVPILRAGRTYRVTRSALLAVLGLTDESPHGAPDPGNPLAEAASPQVAASSADTETAGDR